METWRLATCGHGLQCCSYFEHLLLLNKRTNTNHVTRNPIDAALTDVTLTSLWEFWN